MITLNLITLALANGMMLGERRGSNFGLFILLFFGTMLIAFIAQWRVKHIYHKFSEVLSARGATGAEVAAAILNKAGIRDVQIYEHNAFLGDHYDPLNKRLILSSDNYHGTSLAAIGVAAHEAGHALQHQQAYFPLHLRMMAVGATNIASQIVMWLPLLGMFTHIIAPMTGIAIMAAGWGVIMLFNLITLPVEFDASKRAKLLLRNMGFSSSIAEDAGIEKVLNAAAMTYVAAFITSLLYFLWYVLPLLTGGRSRD